MKANEKTILRFLESSDTNFIIPIYQRKYSWDIDNVKKLFDDLIEINKSKEKYFFGSIVSVYNDFARDREYLIIDGQQRIASISLLILALYKIIKNNDEVFSKRLLNEYIINPYLESENKLKLKLSHEDELVYEKLFLLDNVELSSKLAINYRYFYERILKKEISEKEILEAISKLSIIEIELKASEDNQQLIFESLNSTGVNLTLSDKIRNFILMGKEAQYQTKLYKKYWSIIEENTGSEISDFIKIYLSLKQNNKIPNDDIYDFFKSYISSVDGDLELVLNDMIKYSTVFEKLQKSHFKDFKIDESIKRLDNLGINSMKPFILELFFDFYKSYINKNELLEILDILETYMIRRIICNVPSNSLKKMFISLGEEIRANIDYKENYLEVFKYIILSKEGAFRLPNNMEFKKLFFENEIYLLNNKIVVYILDKLENFENKEKVDIKSLLEEGILSIEHIMPQKLNAKWKNDLGDDYIRIHELYLHTIGNLTLTAYNSKLSNKSFLEKRDMDKGYAQSRLRLNSFLARESLWNEKEIIKRTILLYEDAKIIWKYPKTNYKAAKNIKKLFYINSNLDFSNKKLKGFIFEGENYKAKSFTELYEKMLNILYDIEPILLRSIAFNAEKVKILSCKISNNEKLLKKPYKLVNDIYIDKEISLNAKFDVLECILEIYKINIYDLSFYFK